MSSFEYLTQSANLSALGLRSDYKVETLKDLILQNPVWSSPNQQPEDTWNKVQLALNPTRYKVTFTSSNFACFRL